MNKNLGRPLRLFSNEGATDARIDALTFAIAQLMSARADRDDLLRELRHTAVHIGLARPKSYSQAYSETVEALTRLTLADPLPEKRE